LAWGKSAATKSTPLSISFEMKATLRAKRSSLATTRVAPYRRHRPIQLGPVVALAALNLGHLVRQGPVAAVEEGPDRFPLGFQPEPGPALLGGADPVIGDEATDSHGLNSCFTLLHVRSRERNSMVRPWPRGPVGGQRRAGTVLRDEVVRVGQTT
jgi:hypothetical protein